MPIHEETVALLADEIFMRLAEFEPGEAYYRDVLCRVAAGSPDVTVAELVEAILRVQARADCFQDGPDTVQ